MTSKITPHLYRIGFVLLVNISRALSVMRSTAHRCVMPLLMMGNSELVSAVSRGPVSHDQFKTEISKQLDLADQKELLAHQIVCKNSTA